MVDEVARREEWKMGRVDSVDGTTSLVQRKRKSVVVMGALCWRTGANLVVCYLFVQKTGSGKCMVLL